jgi:hypothetical protein
MTIAHSGLLTQDRMALEVTDGLNKRDAKG